MIITVQEEDLTIFCDEAPNGHDVDSFLVIDGQSEETGADFYSRVFHCAICGKLNDGPIEADITKAIDYINAHGMKLFKVGGNS